MRIVLAAIVALSISVPVTAQPLAEHIPADAMTYIGWQGADRSDAFAQSHFRAVLDALKVRDFFAQILPQLIAQADNRDVDEAFAMFRILGEPSWRYPTAVFVSGTPSPVADGEPGRAARGFGIPAIVRLPSNWRSVWRRWLTQHPKICR